MALTSQLLIAQSVAITNILNKKSQYWYLNQYFLFMIPKRNSLIKVHLCHIFYSSASKSRHTLLIGLCSTLVFVLTKTLRTSPLLPGRVLTMCPRTQEFLGAISSTITTRSPSRKFLLVLFHLFHCSMIGRYSLTHLLQKRSAIYCTCLHLLFEYISSLLNSPGGMTGLVFSWSRWFGVRGFTSFKSLFTVVIGLSFIIASTSHNAVAGLHHLALQTAGLI